MQYWVNIEIARYTIITGETAMTGFSRIGKWYVTMIWIVVFLENIWFGAYASAGGTALAELTAGSETVRIDHVRFDRARSELLVSALYADFADFETLNARAEALGIVLADGGARQSQNAIEGEFTVRLR